ncbi:hypothetical protein CC78DRAFT_308641 [Lojkania enalia]|uniref:Uncharacterized protein n=1 Tax=Lojkania enalia TaxID=147567 RepID=A0A9P4N9W8_9PLEO|nr:hypothetical protein CC78DRAFT_308641 [Didymosphaeria enalia]
MHGPFKFLVNDMYCTYLASKHLLSDPSGSSMTPSRSLKPPMYKEYFIYYFFFFEYTYAPLPPRLLAYMYVFKSIVLRHSASLPPVALGASISPSIPRILPTPQLPYMPRSRRRRNIQRESEA